MVSPNKELQLAKTYVFETGCNVFLTGKAGTGKTTFLQNIRKSCPKRMVVTAPTGVAAINAGGVTLHSFFQMPFGPCIPGSVSEERQKFSREKINLIKCLDLLVIDEISMVRADLLDGVDSVLRRYRRSALPFGGAQLLLIGDLHQLAPVVKDAEWRLLQGHYDSPYFFSSNALRQTELITIELQHIYRQADSHFINLLNRVRENTLDQATLADLNQRVRVGFTDQENRGYITLCTHNSSADTINFARLQTLSAKSRCFTATIEGVFPEHSYPTAVSLELKIGAQVMFLRNDPSPEKRFFNGKIGKITRISGEKIWIKCPDDAEEIMVEPVTWDNIEYSLDEQTLEVTENKIGAFSQYPLKLAWAITIHKSQGLTFDHAIIDAEAAFAHGQVYVALSRCRTLEGLILSSPLSNRVVKTDASVLKFGKEAEKNMPDTSQLMSAKVRYQQRLILDCFDFQKLQGLLFRLLQTVERNGDLVRILGIGDLRLLQQITVKEICAVGTNFARQLQGLFKDTTMPVADTVIVDRLQKASAYFAEKFSAGIGSVVPHLQVESDNKEIRKKAKDLGKRLQEETAIKLAAIRSCANGFSSAEYLRAIGSAEIHAKPKKEHLPTIDYALDDIAHPELWQKLKQWRDEKAKAANIPHYQVMHQKTLIQVAVNLPATLQELAHIKGIGKKLGGKYGEELIHLVQEYRAKHDISEVTLPASKVIELPREVTNHQQEETVQAIKTPTRLLTLQLFTEGATIAEIAEKRGFVVSTIENHLAQCVEQGDVAVDQVLDPGKRQEILAKLHGVTSQNLSEMKEQLANAYSYAELRFVRAYQNFLAGKT